MEKNGSARAMSRMERVPEILAGRPPWHSAVFDDAPADWRRALACWYQAMSPCWLSITPRLRLELVLEAQFWLAAHMIGDLNRSAPLLSAIELTEAGSLGRTLAARIPIHEREDWRTWMRLVLSDLRQALARPVAERDERWGRWLFLVPYSIPAPRPRRSTPAIPGAAEAPEFSSGPHAPLRSAHYS